MQSPRRAALTSGSDDCQETPPNGVDIPVSRFAISENFMQPSQREIGLRRLGFRFRYHRERNMRISRCLQ